LKSTLKLEFLFFQPAPAGAAGAGPQNPQYSTTRKLVNISKGNASMESPKNDTSDYDSFWFEPTKGNGKIGLFEE